MPVLPKKINPAAASTPQPVQPAMSAALIVLLLAVLLGVQPVTTDLYLPALPMLTASFSAPMAQAQLTLSALLLAFGCSQLVWGPLSDRFGRRPVLLCGLTAYTLASMGSVLAQTIDALVVWRVLQGAAMGAVVMSARAVVRDLYTPAEAARVMSKALSGLGVLACLSAPLGGLLANWFGWRAALLALTVFGAGALALVALRFKETLMHKNPNALRPVTLIKTWATIGTNRTFLAFSALSAASYGGLFTFLATSSFVFMQVLGWSKSQYGLVLFFSAFFYIAGTFFCRWLIARWGVRQAVAVAAGLSAAGGTLMAGLAWAGVHHAAALLVPQAIFMVGHGIHQPCGQSGAVAPFPQSAGAASAMNGFLTMVVAFGAGAWLGQHMDGTAALLTNAMGFWGVLIALVAWTLVWNHGEVSAKKAV